MADSTPHAGMVVGEYILESRLGLGATGEVWRAHHHVWTRRLVAVKLATNPEFQRSLSKEGILHDDLAGLNSPYLVKVYGLNVLANPPYMIMELVEGEDLRARLKRVGKLAPAIAREILLDVARGLEAAHSLGIVHRDIKPENVLLDQQGHAKLTDFSIAVAAPDQRSLQMSLHSSPDSAPSLAGTLVYMSPEQRTGRPVTPRSDIYSAGLLLYEMLTGEIPQPGDLISENVPGAPAWCDAIFARCYTREDRRYASASELVADLQSDSIASAPARPAPQPAKQTQRVVPAQPTSGRRRTAVISSRDLKLPGDAKETAQIPNVPTSAALSTRSFERLVADRKAQLARLEAREGAREEARTEARDLASDDARSGESDRVAQSQAQVASERTPAAPADVSNKAAARMHPGSDPAHEDPRKTPQPAAISDLEALLEDMPDLPSDNFAAQAAAELDRKASAPASDQSIPDPRPSRAYDEVLPTLEALYRKERVGPAMAAYSSGQYAFAEDEFKRVLSTDPSNLNARQGLAMTLYRRGNTKGALRIFKEALQQNPDSAETWNNVGVVSMAARRLREAERALLRAIELRPRYAAAHANLSAVYQQQGRLDEARQAANLALEIDPSNDAASFNAGLSG